MAENSRDKSLGAKSSDAEIVKLVLNGNTDAFERLLKRYEHHAIGIVKKHVPTDRVAEVVQDAFVRAYQSLGNFKEAKRFKAWLSTIVTRTCYDFWRTHYRSKEIPLSRLSIEHQAWLEGALAARSEANRQQKARQQEARKVLEWTLAKLSAADRMVIELVYLEGLSHKAAAKLLDFSVANVKVRVFRARQKIHKLLLKGRGKP
jgi:RNA polymerase sigma-70 factor (ECF subfamily)